VLVGGELPLAVVVGGDPLVEPGAGAPDGPLPDPPEEGGNTPVGTTGVEGEDVVEVVDGGDVVGVGAMVVEVEGEPQATENVAECGNPAESTNDATTESVPEPPLLV